MIQINEKLVKYNFSKRTNPNNIKYIAIHDTANKSRGANANSHFKFFNSEDRQSSAHYFVDDSQILRIIKDENRSWAVGDGGGKYRITNDNSINIEMCINVDGDFSKTYKNTLELTKYLMNKYNVPLSNVVRHYDASRKICPNIWKDNNWEKWHKFKEDLSKLISKKEDYKPIITKIYKNLFQREPDDGGLNYWNNKINEGLTFGDFLKALGESKEFEEKYID